MAAKFARNVVNIRGEFQQLEVAFTTLLKSEEKANKLMGEAVDLAAKTPFDLQGVASGARQLLAYGFDAENVTETLRRLGDVAAGLGLPLQRLTYLYGTTRVQGRLYARDMLQFTNSGIPLLDELAKMYGKTTAEINEMVSAGKIGFSDVEKVIRRMTDEGGQFANLMEKQSKTITGQISNIKDAIDVMFNEIGKKSEGAINTVLSGVSLLVENYDKIGRVIGDSVILFGSYKAALMAVSAAHAVATASAKGYTVAELAQYRALLLVEKAQKLLNKTMLSNPYVLAATAIAAVSVNLMRWAKAADKGAQGAKNLTSYIKEQTERMEENRRKAEECLALAEDDTKSNAERRSAIAKLVEIYPKILEQYGNEAAALEHILDIKKQIAAQDLTMKWDEDSAKMDELQAKLKLVNEAIEVNEKSAWGGQAVQSLRNAKKDLEVEIADLQKKMDEYSAPFYNGPEKPQPGSSGDGKVRMVSDIVSEIKSAEKQLDELRSKAKSGLTEKEQQDMKELEDTIKKAKSEYKSFTGQDYGKGGGTVSTANESKRAAQELADMKQDLEMKRVQAELDNLQKAKDSAIVNAGEIYKKRIELLNLEEKKKLASIDAEIAAASSAFEKEALEQQKELVKASYTIDRKSLQDESVRNYSVELNRKLDEYQTYVQKRKQMETDLNDDLSTLEKVKKNITDPEDLEQIEAAIIVIRQRLQELVNDDFEQTAEYQKFFTANLTMASSEVHRVADVIRKNLNEQLRNGNIGAEEFLDTWRKIERQVKEVDTQASKLATYSSEGINGLIEKSRTLGSQKQAAGAADYEQAARELSQALAKNDKAAAANAQSSMAAAEAVQAEGAAMEGAASEAATTVAIIDAIINGINDCIHGIDDALGLISEVADSFGADTSDGSKWGQVTKAFDTFATASQYATDGWNSLKSGNIGGVIKGVVGSITSWITGINQMVDADKQKDLEALQKRVNKLAEEYDELGESVAKALGSNASKLIDEQNKKLEQQIFLLRQQKQLEEDKKNTDAEAIEEYERQIGATQKQIQDNKAAAIDAIFGEDVRSAIANLAEGITGALAKGSSAAQGARDTIKTAFQQMITTAIEAYVQASGAMERIRGTMQQAMLDDIVTDEERARIEDMATQLANEVEQKYGWASRFFQEDSQREAATRNSLGASQESVDESNGRLTAIQGIAYDIREGQKVQTDVLADLRAESASILDVVMGIHNDTAEMRVTMGDVRAMVKEIRSNVGTMTDRGVKML